MERYQISRDAERKRAGSIAMHRVDAVTLATPSLQVAIAAGKVEVIGHPFSAIAPRFLRAAWFATKDYVAKNPEIVQRFRQSIETASADVNAHPASTGAAVAAFTGLDPQMISHMQRAHAGTSLDTKLVQPVIDAAFRYGAITASFDAKEIIAG